ncbi:MAG: hypothetical protein HRT35_34335 [Algicola sp.]|nr:hypothetical protein [Algicola sp.]
MGILLEDRIVLHYISPMYFFVAPYNVLLAKRIETGLRIAQQDGSFDRLFNAYLTNLPGYDPNWLKNAKLLKLDNPLLPPLTPLEDQSLWYR